MRQRHCIPSRTARRRGCVFKRHHSRHGQRGKREKSATLGAKIPSDPVLTPTGRPETRGRMAGVRRKAPRARAEPPASTEEIDFSDLARSLHRLSPEIPPNDASLQYPGGRHRVEKCVEPSPVPDMWRERGVSHSSRRHVRVLRTGAVRVADDQWILASSRRP
jgi:hypothetical protein